MRELAEAALPHGREHSYAWGMLAFALEQAGALDAAEDAGRRAVGMNRDDPWAQHAVAHVLEARGDPETRTGLPGSAVPHLGPLLQLHVHP